MAIKFICLNIWLGGLLFDEALEFLKQADADVVLLQEVFNSEEPSAERRFRTVEELQKVLGYPHQDFALEFQQIFPFGNVPRGNAILSKFPITESQSHWLTGEYGEYEDILENFPKFQHVLQQVTIEANGTKLNVFNFQGVWDLDGERDSPDRLQMSQNILKAIEGKENVVLAGDTNANPNTHTIRNIEAKLTNIYKDELTTSFNLRRKDLEKYPGYATAVVDMAFVSPNLKVLDHQCPDIDVSDHLPLIFTLEV